MAEHVRDPVHGSIALADWALPLLAHPVFQRLRRIQQLGTAHLVYPGAHHKRFEHSIGAYHLAGLLAEGLALDDQEGRTLRAAALLHDVGHGPFSHAFEELMRETGERHESTTLDLVRWGPLADLLRQGGLDPVAVGDAVVGQGPLAKLVSGAIDADRMDYLMRDAHYTGVRANVDPDRLRSVIERAEDGSLLLREAGILAAEGLLTTRFLMYPTVYYHHTVRSSEAMLVHGIRCFVEQEGLPLASLQNETDDGLLHRIRDAGGIAGKMIQGLDERRLYKRALRLETQDFESELVQQCLEDPRRERQIADEIAQQAGVSEHEVFVDVPRPPRFEEMDLRVKRRDDSIVPIMEASSLVRILHEARLDHWRAFVFAPRKLADRVEKAAASVFASQDRRFK